MRMLISAALAAALLAPVSVGAKSPRASVASNCGCVAACRVNLKNSGQWTTLPPGTCKRRCHVALNACEG